MQINIRIKIRRNEIEIFYVKKTKAKHSVADSI